MGKIWDLQARWADWSEKHQKGFDLVFGIIFAVAYAYQFFITTMISAVTPDNILNVLFNVSRVTTVLGAILAVLAIAAVRNRGQMLFEALVLVFLALYYVKGSYHPVYGVMIFTLAATGRSARKLVGTTLAIGLIGMAVCIALDATGVLPPPAMVHPPKHALGILYHTDAGAHLLNLALAYAYLRPMIRKEHPVSRKLLTILADIVIIGGFTALAGYTGGRNNFYLLIFMTAGTLIYDFFACFGWGRGKISAALHAIVGVPAAAVLSVITWLFYTKLNWHDYPFDSWISQITDTRSIDARIYYGKLALEQHPLFSLWGEFVEEGGNGGLAPKSGLFVDSSYLRIPMFYGMGITVIFWLFFGILQVRHIRQKRFYAVFLVLIALLSGIIEHHLIAFSYVFFIFLPFTREEGITGKPAEKSLPDNESLSNGETSSDNESSSNQ